MPTPISPAELREQRARSQECVNGAIFAGLKAGSLSLGVAGGLTYGLQHYSPFFRSHFTVGAKASFVALPVFYAFWHACEKAISLCSRENSGNNRFMRPRGYKSRADLAAEAQAADAADAAAAAAAAAPAGSR